MNPNPKTIAVKRGSTLSIVGAVKLPLAPDWSAIASVAKNNNTPIDSLDVDLTLLPTVGKKGETHSIRISRDATNTQGWPVGNLSCDIKFTAGTGLVVHSPTFVIAVQQQITA